MYPGALLYLLFVRVTTCICLGPGRPGVQRPKEEAGLTPPPVTVI